jgi:hypothetical protein
MDNFVDFNSASTSGEDEDYSLLTVQSNTCFLMYFWSHSFYTIQSNLSNNFSFQAFFLKLSILLNLISNFYKLVISFFVTKLKKYKEKLRKFRELCAHCTYIYQLEDLIFTWRSIRRTYILFFLICKLFFSS